MTSEKFQTVGDLIRWGEQQFENAGLYYGHGTDNAWDEAVYLVLFSLQIPFNSTPEILQTKLSADQIASTLALLKRRIEKRIPAAYLTNCAWFCSLPFYVDERVLVPRSPLAELIDQQFSPWLQAPPKRILDLCTGSGCIGIACAHSFTEAEVVLSDISADALAVAQRNIADHSLKGRVVAVQSDLFENLQGEQFDLVISNPPYVDADDFQSMPDEYHYEPEIGLTSGDDGLDFTRRLLAEAATHLTNNGILIAEVGNSWLALDQAYPQLPFTWLEFEHGGHGVFVLSKKELAKKDLLEAGF